MKMFDFSQPAFQFLDQGTEREQKEKLCFKVSALSVKVLLFCASILNCEGLWNNAYLELLILVLIHKTPVMGNTNGYNLATLNSVKDNNMMDTERVTVSSLNVYRKLRLDVFGTLVELLCTCEPF